MDTNFEFDIQKRWDKSNNKIYIAIWNTFHKVQNCKYFKVFSGISEKFYWLGESRKFSKLKDITFFNLFQI